MQGLQAFFFVALVVVVVVVAVVWRRGRSNSLLHQWAAQNQYRIIRQEYRFFFRGPYFWTRPKDKPSIMWSSKTPMGTSEVAGSTAAAGGLVCYRTRSKCAGTTEANVRIR